MVIGTGVNLHFDFGAAGNRAVKKSFAWDRRNPDVFGADQYHERNGSRPRWLLPLLVARCRIEGYRRSKIAPRQLGRPARALRADREEKSARPATSPLCQCDRAEQKVAPAETTAPHKRLAPDCDRAPGRRFAVRTFVFCHAGQSYRPSALHIHGGSARQPNRFLRARSSSPSTGHRIHVGI